MKDDIAVVVYMKCAACNELREMDELNIDVKTGRATCDSHYRVSELATQTPASVQPEV